MNTPPLVLGPMEWGLVALSCAIILAILGPRLIRDIRRWTGRS
jgi:hypothetical protein